MHITIVAGTRPNFVKVSPIIHAIKDYEKKYQVGLEYTLVHTGQHYDDKMSGSFFTDLNIPQTDVNLNVGSCSHSEQTAKIMVAFEKHLLENRTDCVLVVGDVNSTMACAVVTKKLNLKLVHVEGGLRSLDRSMPEEINRLLTDSVTDYFFTTSQEADENLLKEGIEKERIFLVGNVMIDSLVKSLEKTRFPNVLESEDLEKYFLLTLHRPSNVDDTVKLNTFLKTIDKAAGEAKVVFPVHPRTESKITNKGDYQNILFIPPLPYLEFLDMMKKSVGVVTDSGGIQEETTYLKIPCVTLRENTERPETIHIGTNELIGENLNLLTTSIEKISIGEWKKGSIPTFWDGKASDRIVSKLVKLLS
ncbi:UDP-N-acetylglucosamine 2-epimerase (non-hydrolyzing) [uncultured Roseivirga sp.]|uniref:non-hydrolyzing UDP-N-acetylglucosamine 2-epimerase n=1 Tax=uncultured Roseivirga sp. TaxID=543088 RepID=UPI000D78E3FF|nr:UDP-N-acetylglucosamine 2-epimerase (non-hydrolyzing) [uncultured Roseivirga sp.]PWL28077.1 MAG: UDP-N-acetylglucosamine 2-epimerase (non-hydrolyzing) [Roseivirga sp. XM-24bin3]